jgi:hypothetical protein
MIPKTLSLKQGEGSISFVEMGLENMPQIETRPYEPNVGIGVGDLDYRPPPFDPFE